MKKFIVVGCLFITGVCCSQVMDTSSVASSSSEIIVSKNRYEDIFHQKFNFGLAGFSNSYSLLTPIPMKLNNPFMSGMFCKMECKIETMSGVAPRFRLGSLNYTEWMEGKQEIYMRYRK
jgi:hypothetical protein